MLEIRNRHARQRPPPLGLPSPACMLPIHHAYRNTKRFRFIHRSPPLSGCSYNIAGRRRPFDPVPLQNLHLYYERLRPCAPHWYSGSRKGYPLELLPSHRDDRFLRSSLKPGSGSRRLNAGCRLDSKQVSSNLIPKRHTRPRFWHHLQLSTCHQRFTCVRLLDPSPDKVTALPFPSTLTTMALYQCSLGWFETRSCKPISRDLPSSPMKLGIRQYYGDCLRSTQNAVAFPRMSRSIVTRANSARKRLISICSAVTCAFPDDPCQLSGSMQLHPVGQASAQPLPGSVPLLPSSGPTPQVEPPPA